MSTQLNRKLSIVIVLTLVVMLAGAVVPWTVGAQGGDCTPPRRGIRPDALAFAVSGPQWVGVREFTIEDSERPLSVTAWYPALNPDCTEERVIYQVTERIHENSVLRGVFPRTGNAIPDAALDTGQGPYPLVIFSHALWSQRWQSEWLAEHLASRGYVVLATDHEDHPQMGMYDFEKAVFSRPKDIARQIDYAETLTAADGAMAGMIDMEKVGVIGHDSWGALGALLVAGARLDLAPLRVWCKDHPSYVCTQTLVEPLEKTADRLGYPREGLWPSMADPRVDAIITLSGWAGFFGPAGLQGVAVPTLAVSTSFDEDPDDGYDVATIYDGIAAADKALVVFEGADWNIFFAECTGERPMNSVDFAACSDRVWDMDSAHDVTNYYVTAFLQAMLKGEFAGQRVLRSGVGLFRSVTVESIFSRQ